MVWVLSNVGVVAYANELGLQPGAPQQSLRKFSASNNSDNAVFRSLLDLRYPRTRTHFLEIALRIECAI
eukprot:5193143-Amphidinium_carterae.1